MNINLIYEFDEAEISFDPYTYPDYWWIINGIDFGWDHPQAHIQLVWDKDRDVIYITQARKLVQKEPYEAWHVVKPWAENVPVAWPSEGLQHKIQPNGEAVPIKALYETEGFNLLYEPATFEDGGNSVWPGIVEINNSMRDGSFKIASNLVQVFEEIHEYHTETLPDGTVGIAKSLHELLDAMRYAFMMRRYAIRICDLFPDPHNHQPGRVGRKTNPLPKTGY